MGNLTLQALKLPPLVVSCRKKEVLSISWAPELRRQKNWASLNGTPTEQTFLKGLQRDLNNYFSGELVSFNWPIDWKQGTPFQRQVWQTLMKIPYGQTRSYQWLAEKIGRPGAARAIGQANSQNPLTLIVPCHRVIRQDGSIGGYTPSIDIKRQLLQLEAS